MSSVVLIHPACVRQVIVAHAMDDGAVELQGQVYAEVGPLRAKLEEMSTGFLKPEFTLSASNQMTLEQIEDAQRLIEEASGTTVRVFKVGFITQPAPR